MAPVPIDSQVLHHKDAEMLARATRLPFAAVGTATAGVAGSIRIRLGLGRPVADGLTRVPTGEISTLVKRLLAASTAAERDRIDPDIKLEDSEDPPGTVAWLRSDRCLVAAPFPLAGTAPFVALVAAAPGSAFPRWQRELARLALMQESARIDAQIPVETPSRGGILESVLDRLTLPITVVDRAGKAVYCNGAARASFGADGPLRLADGRVVAREEDANRRLHVAIRAATAGSGCRSQMILLSGDPDGGRLTQRGVVVTPVAASQGLALLVGASSQQDGSMLSLMLSELGLTPTEQRLASRLIHGDCLDDAADQINVKLSTARSYLRNIFDKTGASRQSQLVALALSLTPPTSVAESPAEVEAAPPRPRAASLAAPGRTIRLP